LLREEKYWLRGPGFSGNKILKKSQSMKTIYLTATLLVLSPLAARSQSTANNSSSSPIQPNRAFAYAGQGLPASPNQNGLPSSPVNPGLPGFTNAFGGLGLTNQFGSNLVPANLSALMANLENDMIQLLPVLAAYNNSIDLTASTGTNTQSTLPTTGSNLGTSLAGNASSRVSGNASGNLSSSISSTPNSSGATTVGTVSTSRQNTLTPTGVNNPNGQQPAFGNGGFNPEFLSPAARSSVRALFILESDLERTLPLVNSLNGGGDLNTVLGINSTGLQPGAFGSIGAASQTFNGRGAATTTTSSQNTAVPTTGTR
jgi:hypothetical protein